MVKWLAGLLCALFLEAPATLAQDTVVHNFAEALSAEMGGRLACGFRPHCGHWCGEAGAVQFIVQRNPNPDVSSTGVVSALQAFGRVTPLKGELGRRGYALYNVSYATLADAALVNVIADLLRNRALSHFEIDSRFGAASPPIPNDPLFGEQLSLHNPQTDLDLNAPEAWKALGPLMSDAKVCIGTVDTGIDDTCPWNARLSCDLAGQACAKQDLTISNRPMDYGGHGTMMASVIAAKGDNDLGIAGTMWGARIHSCKIAASLGAGCSSTMAACLAEIAKQSDKCPKVAAINVSWEGPQRSCLVEQQIIELRKKGILVVASAGNAKQNNDDAAGCPVYPASYPISNVISVGAADYDGNVSTNRGKRTVHVVVAQDKVPTIRANNDSELPPDIFSVPGSSVAAAQVSGLIAMVKAKYPEENWVALRNRVIAGGIPWPVREDGTSTGLKDWTISGRRARAWDDKNGWGSLTCSEQFVRRRLLPVADEVTVSVTEDATVTPVEIRALSIECDKPVTPLDIKITDENGQGYPSPEFKDDGLPPDDHLGDGEWAANWFPPATSGKTFKLSFWNVYGSGPVDDELTVKTE